MIGNWELKGLSEAEQHYILSDAYAEAAHLLASALLSGSYPKTYSHAKVILSLHHHSIELFLKYALRRAKKTFSSNHYLRELLQLYTATYPDAKYSFQPDFIPEFLEHTGQQVQEELKEESKDKNKIDQSLRYHTDKAGEPWPGVYGIIPESYLADIILLRERIHSLHALIEEQ